MPDFPRHESKAQLSSSQPSVQAPADNTGEVIAEAGQKIGNAVQENAIKWSNAVDTIQKTTASANFKSGILDIQQRAQNDPDYNNSDKYFKEIEKLKTDNLKGFNSKTAETEAGIEFGYESKVAQYQIENLYKKKLVDVGQASMFKNLDLMVRDNGDIENRISKFLGPLIRDQIIGREDAYKIQKEYVKKANSNAFLMDAKNDPEKAKENLSKNTYNFTSKELISNQKILKESNKEAAKQVAIVQNQNEQKMGELFLADAPADQVINELDAALQQGAISAENYNLAKQSLEHGFSGDSNPTELVTLMTQYSKIGEAEDPVKAQRDFRNQVFIRKPNLSEVHFKQFLQWTGSQQMESNTPKMSGLRKFLEAAGAGLKGGIPPLAVKGIYDTAKKFMSEEYKPGQKISKGGRQFEVVKNDDGSLGFKEIK